jgi:hypothetical protein
LSQLRPGATDAPQCAWSADDSVTRRTDDARPTSGRPLSAAESARISGAGLILSSSFEGDVHHIRFKGLRGGNLRGTFLPVLDDRTGIRRAARRTPAPTRMNETRGRTEDIPTSSPTHSG